MNIGTMLLIRRICGKYIKVPAVKSSEQHLCWSSAAIDVKDSGHGEMADGPVANIDSHSDPRPFRVYSRSIGAISKCPSVPICFLGKISSPFHLAPLQICNYGVSSDGKKRSDSGPKYAPLKSVGFVLLRIISLYLCGRQVDFRADPSKLSGWLWFLGRLGSLCIFGYGIYGCLPCDSNSIPYPPDPRTQVFDSQDQTVQVSTIHQRQLEVGFLGRFFTSILAFDPDIPQPPDWSGYRESGVLRPLLASVDEGFLGKIADLLVPPFGVAGDANYRQQRRSHFRP